MSKQKKICLVIPTLQAGGMQRVMSELANCFAEKANFEIHLIMYGKCPETFYLLKPNIIQYSPKEIFNDSRRILSTIKRLMYLRKTIKKINPDTVLSFGEYWNNFVLIALSGIKIPIYVSDRCKPDKSLGRFHDSLRIWFYPKATGVIVQTSFARNIYSNIVSEDKIKIIGNPVREIIGNLGKNNCKNILMVSRIIATKHHDRLISIFAKLNAPDWKLVIVGAEAQKQKHLKRLKELSEQLGISNRVFFEGERKDVEKYYLESSVFAFTSSSEGFPNVIGEALSSGLPVVSYNCVAGPSDMIVDGENGFLVPVFDDDQFQEKIQLLIDDEVLRKKMAEKAKESIKLFSAPKIGQEYLEFILS